MRRRDWLPLYTAIRSAGRNVFGGISSFSWVKESVTSAEILGRFMGGTEVIGRANNCKPEILFDASVRTAKARRATLLPCQTSYPLAPEQKTTLERAF